MRASRSRGHDRRTDQRGAMAIFLTLLIAFVMIPMGALAVDIGMQRVARTDMQSLADAIALDLAREIDGSTAASVLYPTLANLAAESLARNSGNTFSDTAVVQAIDLGTVSSANFGSNGYFTALPTTSSATPTAVRVTMHTPVGFHFFPSESGSATRSSIAIVGSTACFRLGSYALALDSNNSTLLKGLVESALGGSVSLSALSYQGLASADISLSALAAELGVGTVDELVALNNVSVANLFVAAASVLQKDGDAADANILNSIAANLGPLSTISLAGLASVTSGNGAAETATISALDLVAGSAFLANGSSTLSIPGLTTNLGLTATSLVTALNVTQSPQLACGKKDVTKASTSQAHVAITGTLASVPSLPASLLGISASVAASSTTIDVDLAKATGTLKEIVCGDATAASPEGVDVLVGSQLGVASSLQQTVSVNGTLGSGVLGGLLGSLLGSVYSVQVSGTVVLKASTTQPTENRTATIRVPNSPTSYDVPVSTGSGSLGLDSATVTTTWTSGPTLTAKNILGVNVTLTASQIASLTSSIVSGVTGNVLSPLLTTINSQLVSPLSSLLGVDLAGADVFGVPRPICNSPSLAG